MSWVSNVMFAYNKNKWVYAWAFVLILPLFLLIYASNSRPIVPFPIYTIMIYFLFAEIGGLSFLAYSGFVLSPLAYCISTYLLSRFKKYRNILIYIIGLVFLLNIIYILWIWRFGVNYHGYAYTIVPSVLSVVIFSAAMSISFYGLRRESIKLLFTANFLLFFALAWCAFPILGELP